MEGVPSSLEAAVVRTSVAAGAEAVRVPSEWACPRLYAMAAMPEAILKTNANEPIDILLKNRMMSENVYFSTS